MNPCDKNDSISVNTNPSLAQVEDSRKHDGKNRSHKMISATHYIRLTSHYMGLTSSNRLFQLKIHRNFHNPHDNREH